MLGRRRQPAHVVRATIRDADPVEALHQAHHRVKAAVVVLDRTLRKPHSREQVWRSMMFLLDAESEVATCRMLVKYPELAAQERYMAKARFV